MGIVADAIACSLADGVPLRLVTPASREAQRAAADDLVSRWIKKGRRHLNPDTLAPEAAVSSGLSWRRLLEYGCPKCPADLEQSGRYHVCAEGCGFAIGHVKLAEMVIKMRGPKR